MTRDERDRKRAAQATRAQRKNRLLIGSTWSVMAAAFAGFFILWNHLGSTTKASASQSSTTAAATTQPYTDGQYHQDGGTYGYSGGGTSSGSGGSASISPSPGSDFSSGAS